MAAVSNALSRAVSMAHKLPVAMQPAALTLAFNSAVKFAGTAGIKVVSASNSEVQMALENKTKVQNHIGGVHACAMALLCESCTGMVFGLNVPHTHLPLIKSMKIDYKRRAKGSLTAIARLNLEQIQRITTDDRGDVVVAVEVRDESQATPILAEMVWAWVPADRKKDTAKDTAKDAAGGGGGGGVSAGANNSKQPVSPAGTTAKSP